MWSQKKKKNHKPQRKTQIYYLYHQRKILGCVHGLKKRQKSSKNRKWVCMKERKKECKRERRKRRPCNGGVPQYWVQCLCGQCKEPWSSQQFWEQCHRRAPPLFCLLSLLQCWCPRSTLVFPFPFVSTCSCLWFTDAKWQGLVKVGLVCVRVEQDGGRGRQSVEV